MSNSRRASAQATVGGVLGLLGICVLVVIAFVRTIPHIAYAPGPDVASIITALSTLGIFITAVVAAIVAFVQFKEVQRTDKIQATTALLREWSRPKMQRILGFVDHYPTAVENRTFANRFYKAFVSGDFAPSDLEKRKKYIKRKRKAQDEIHNGIQDISLMATRTWNLLDHAIIDETVLFGQLDYDVLSTYFILEDVLNQRADKENFLYHDFTMLARRAQQHYKRREYREVVDELIDADLRDLSFGN